MKVLNIFTISSLFFVFSLLDCHIKSNTDLEKKMVFSFGESGAYGIEVNHSTIWPYNLNGVKYGVTGKVETSKNYLTSDGSFIFWTEVPEGNYSVQVISGDENAPSNITIKAESRRLMVYNKELSAKQIDTVEFVVNVRSAKINESDSIKLKPREFPYVNWDTNLSLEFGGVHPCVRSVTITPVSDLPTIFLAGNSTVVDQEEEPWASWGQMFPAFLNKNVVVANFAESGETLKSFIWEKRFDKIASMIKPGDFIFMEFAHNDQKPGSGHVEPYSTYDEHLMKFVNLARENDATPVFVTSTNRRSFDANGNIKNTLEEYPDAMRELAKKEDVFLIDLNAMSKKLFEAMGVEGSKQAFVHYAANSFPGQNEPIADNTHFSTYGAWQLAKCVATGIVNSNCELKNYLKKDFEAFDPNKPDPVDTWAWPMSIKASTLKPDGN